MAQITSGKVLREARERKGFDLNTVARRLRIRPDILRAIEAGDFSVMPPRGYTRNMVNAYARLLGLNPTEIVNMYLDEAYANQVERARGSSTGRSFDMERAARRTRTNEADSVSVNRSYESGRTSTIHGSGTRATRVLYDDGTRYSRDDYGVTREKTERPGRSERDFISHHSGYDTTDSSYMDESAQRKSSRSIHVGETPMSYSAPRIPAFLQRIISSRVALIVAAAVIVALVAGIAFAVAGNNDSKDREDVEKMPVSGVVDTTGGSGSSAAATVEIAPTSARVTYTVPQGQECYVQTELDGKASEETITGPGERNVEVTGVWTIKTWTPESMELTVDGTKVQLKSSDEYGDMYGYTVDFPSILAEWNKTHGSASSAAKSKSSASASAASAQSAAATGTSSTTATTQSFEEEVNYTDPEGPTSQSAGEGVTDEESDEELDEEQEEESEEEYEEEYGAEEDQEYVEEEYQDEQTYDDGGEYYEDESQDYDESYEDAQDGYDEGYSEEQ